MINIFGKSVVFVHTIGLLGVIFFFTYVATFVKFVAVLLKKLVLCGFFNFCVSFIFSFNNSSNIVPLKFKLLGSFTNMVNAVIILS